MRPEILCLERLNRIPRVLCRAHGKMSLRDLIRSLATWPRESEQAVEFAWLLIKTRPFLNEMAMGGHEIVRRRASNNHDAASHPEELHRTLNSYRLILARSSYRG
jgi:hypothetical protein